MVFWDTETIPHREGHKGTIQTFRLGVAHYWYQARNGRNDKHEWYPFTEVGAFWDWTLDKARSHTVLYLIAHNLAFDAQVVRTFVELPRRGWMLLFLYEQGATRLVKWGWPTPELKEWITAGKTLAEYEGHRWVKTILMMDNCNLFPGSIELWGQQLGFPKLPRPPYKAGNELWFPYCKRDVEIMVRLWQEWFPFLDAQGLGTFRPTIGSQAFSGFRHAYMNNRIEIHTNEPTIALEREAYYGGRCEAFYIGRLAGQELYKLDVNSMYPYVMYEKQYPARLHKVGAGLTIPELEKALTCYGLTARVELDCDLPVFPVKRNHKNIYPIGRYSAVLSTPEIALALERGWVRSVGEYATYRMRRVFFWYVEHFYKLKQEYERQGDKLHRQLVKLLLNSLYGKFGQAGYEDRLIGTTDPERLEVSYGMQFPERVRTTTYIAGGSVIQQQRKGEGYNSFVAIAAHVTAYARLYLWTLIERAGQDHVFYCDTDSLVVDRAGYDVLTPYLDRDRLGMLKLEETASDMEIRAPKDYTFGQHKVTKGIPLSASLLAPDSWQVETWPSLRSHIADGHRDTFHNKDIVKTLTYSVDWGELQPSGWVKPYWYGVSPLQF